MSKADFCCPAAQKHFLEFYNNQAAGGMPVFAGARHQRGHGIGSFFSNIWRTIWPVLKPMAREAGSRALQADTRIGGDLISGDKGFKESVKERFGQAIRGEGAYKRKRTAPHKQKRSKNNKRARQVCDFFAS